MTIDEFTLADQSVRPINPRHPSRSGLACPPICAVASHTLRRNLRNKIIVAIAAVALFAATTPVLTVTNGQPDGNGHPYVGLAIQFNPNNPGFITLCSGSALSPTVFLTAAR